MSNFWGGRNVLVTGAAGFIGSHVAEALVRQGARVTAAVSPTYKHARASNLQHIRADIDIVPADLTALEDCVRVCRNQDVVVNAAHVDGSAAFKRAHPALIFRQNMLMSLNMLEAACQGDADRFLVMSSTEVYSPETTVPMMEADGFVGLPAQTTDGYAWSKRMSEFAAEVCAREHGLKVAIARPSNVYGPGDHFDAGKGRVIPMFIQKVFHDDGPIVIWGNGEQVRTFLYVGDLAQGLLALIEKHPTSEPINFGGSQEITIKALADLIVNLSGRPVRIMCDLDKPSGAPNRTPDTTKARQLLHFTCDTPLEIGLQRTIDLYRDQYLSEDNRLVSALP